MNILVLNHNKWTYPHVFVCVCVCKYEKEALSLSDSEYSLLNWNFTIYKEYYGVDASDEKENKNTHTNTKQYENYR